MSGLAGTPTSDQVVEAISRLKHTETNMRRLGVRMPECHTPAGCPHCVALGVLESALESCGVIQPKPPSAEEITRVYNWLKDRGQPTACRNKAAVAFAIGSIPSRSGVVVRCTCPYCKAWAPIEGVLRAYVEGALSEGL